MGRPDRYPALVEDAALAFPFGHACSRGTTRGWTRNTSALQFEAPNGSAGRCRGPVRSRCRSARVVSHAVEPFNGSRDRRPVFSDLVRELGEPERGGAGTSARGGDIERGQTFDPERVLESPRDQVLDATLAEVEPGLPVFRLAWREHHTQQQLLPIRRECRVDVGRHVYNAHER